MAAPENDSVKLKARSGAVDVFVMLRSGKLVKGIIERYEIRDDGVLDVYGYDAVIGSFASGAWDYIQVDVNAPTNSPVSESALRGLTRVQD